MRMHAIDVFNAGVALRKKLKRKIKLMDLERKKGGRKTVLSYCHIRRRYGNLKKFNAAVLGEIVKTTPQGKLFET